MLDTSAATVQEFEARHTPEERLLRYARGRVNSFLSRQALTLSGTVFLYFLVSPAVGLVACIIALTGEAVDCLTLHWLTRRVPHRMSLRKAYFISSLSGAFQAATISACVTLAWVTAPPSGGGFFSLAYLTGAVINAGIVLPFHRPVTVARLGVYAICVLGLFIDESFFHPPDPISTLFYDLAGAVMMGYMAYIFIKYTTEGYHRQLLNRHDLMVHSDALSKAYAELRENQKEARKLSLVAKHAMDSVIMSDSAGRIQWVNDTFSKITGYRLDEVVGKTPAEVLNGPETDLTVSEEIANAVLKGQPHRTEILNYTKQGQKIWIETTLVPVLDDHGTVEMIVAIERDITSSKTHAEELARAKSEAEAGARAKSRFLATMSHELRTPMNGVIGLADLLCEAKLSPEHHGYAETIKSSAESLLGILNDILDLSKLDADRVELSPVDFDPRACLAGVIRLLQPQAASRGLSLELCDDGLSRIVNLDDTRLRQILLNIIGNALKFTESGGVRIHANTNPENQLIIRIKDTGIGIPPDRLNTIFDSFAQAEADTTRRFGGTGLGLTISRKLAQAMGGTISVQSAVGEGSSFIISLPFRPPQGRTANAQGSGQPVIPNNLTVLVAEDNKTNRLVMRKFLKNIVADLHFAHDGEQAVTLADDIHPDIIFMDMSMPRMDGITATRHIRASSVTQPRIIALTANGFASDRQACLEAGMDDFLTKPVRKADLLQSLSLLDHAG